MSPVSDVGMSPTDEQHHTDILNDRDNSSQKDSKIDTSKPQASEHSSISTSQSETAAKPVNPRVAVLASRKTSLEARLAELQAKRSNLVAKGHDAKSPCDSSPEQQATQALTSAHAVIKSHIALLQRYNEMKDVGLGLMGMVAESRGVRVSSVLEDYGMSDKD